MNKTAKIFTYKLYLTLIFLILLLLCSSSYAMAAAEAKITSHPAGNSMEVGVADFYLEVQANSPDGGELLYQWFVSSYSDMHDMKAVALPDDEKYGKTSTLIPPQELGTLYYCVEIVNYSNGRHSRPVLSNVATVTFSPFTLHVADIRDIDQPESTKKPDTTAERHSDDVLSSFYGYDITGIKWAPNDALFAPDTVYSVEIELELWEESIAAEDFVATINGEPASMVSSIGQKYIFSYTFPATEADKDTIATDDTTSSNPEDTPSADDEQPKDPPILLLGLLLMVLIIALAIIVIILFRSRPNRS